MQYADIFSYIKQEEIAFDNDVEITPNWFWNFKKHINWTILFKHGKFPMSENNYTRPNKNIIMPVLDVQYRAEDIDLKDINIFVDDADKYHLSLLVKKYHDEVYAPDHKLNTFFDETKEEKIDFGGVIVRNGKDGPIYEPLENIAFCDKTNFLTGPICFKNEYTPEELYEKQNAGWGKTGADITIDDLITQFEVANIGAKANGLACKDKLEIYRIHGSLPSNLLDDKIKDRYTRQLQIVAFYQKADGKATGVTLYKSKELENPFKVHLGGKKIKNRALAFGGVEKLFDPQIWTNFSEVVKHDFLKAASKVLLYSDDEAFATKQNVTNQENLQVNYIEQGKSIQQIPTTPVNIRLFDEWINEMQTQAERLGSAFDPLMGAPSPSGVPFRAQLAQIQQGMGSHEYRKGKFEDFIQEIYMDWILPEIQKEILNGTKFLATLDADQMEYIATCISRNQVANEEKQKVLNGDFGAILTKEERDARIQEIQQQTKAKGNKWFMEILKGEFEGVPLKVKVSVGNRNKDLAGITDKLSNLFKTIFANPAILDDPRAAKTFAKILEYSGMNPSDFETTYQKPQQMQQMPQQMQQPQIQQPQIRQPQIRQPQIRQPVTA